MINDSYFCCFFEKKLRYFKGNQLHFSSFNLTMDAGKKYTDKDIAFSFFEVDKKNAFHRCRYCPRSIKQITDNGYKNFMLL